MTFEYFIDITAIDPHNLIVLSDEAQKELQEQAKRDGWDLLHDLMLYNYAPRFDGAYLKIDNDGHLHDIVNKPNQNKTIIEKMRKEIEELSPKTRYEVMVKLATKYPEIAAKLDDLYVNLLRLRS